jgi:hypothetical protein
VCERQFKDSAAQGRSLTSWWRIAHFFGWVKKGKKERKKENNNKYRH